MNEHFWCWFFRKVALEEQIILPNLGTFSLCYESTKTYPIKSPVREQGPNMSYDDEGGYYFQGYSYRDVVRESSYRLQARVRIRFRPTGTFRADLKQVIIEKKRPQKQPHVHRWGGDRSPKTAVLVWGSKMKDPSELSLHRRLIWSYHQDKGLSLLDAAAQVSSALHHFATSLLGYSNRYSIEPGTAHMTSECFASVVYGRMASNKADGKRGPLRYTRFWDPKTGNRVSIPIWRVRLIIPQPFLVSILAEQNI